MQQTRGSFQLGPLIVDEAHKTVSFEGRPIDIAENFLDVLRLWKVDSKRSVGKRQIESAYKLDGTTGAKAIRYLLLQKLKPLNIPEGQFDIYSPSRGAYRLRFGSRGSTLASETIEQSTKIRPYGSWAVAVRKMSKAERSILILDVFFSEHTMLRKCVADALKMKSDVIKQGQSSGRLEISVYMTSPSVNFGAQRNKEIEGPDIDNAAYIEMLKQKISDKGVEHVDYKRDFKRYAARLRQIQKKYKHAIDLKVFEYFAMPSIRLIVVDDTHFIFGWFPLWEQNPTYFCLYLEDDRNLKGADEEVVNCLRGQIDNFKAISKPYLSA
jgi:hypothetical protein